MASPKWGSYYFRKAALGLGALAVVVAPAAGAEDQEVPASPASSNYELAAPHVDLRSDTDTVVGYTAASLSADGVALVLYGVSSEMYEAADSAVVRSRDQDVPSGIVLSGHHPELPGVNAVEVYVGGMKMFPGGTQVPVAIPPDQFDKSYYYTTIMKMSLEAYQEVMQQAGDTDATEGAESEGYDN